MNYWSILQLLQIKLIAGLTYVTTMLFKRVDLNTCIIQAIVLKKVANKMF